MPDLSDHERPIGSIQDYLSGRLSEDEATVFEERCLEDEELAVELELALEIKAAGEGRKRARSTSRQPAPSGRRWGLLAAAAVVVLAVGLGIALMVESGVQEQEPLRGAESPLELSLSRDGSEVTVSWREVDGADGGYRVELFHLDGSQVAMGETFEQQLAIAVPPEAATEPLYARVQALGPLRDVIVESSLEAVPAGEGANER